MLLVCGDIPLRYSYCSELLELSRHLKIRFTSGGERGTSPRATEEMCANDNAVAKA